MTGIDLPGTGRLRTICILMITALLAACGALLLSAPPARAASDGVMMDYGGWTVGTRQVDSGEFVYCIEPGAITPAGQQHGPAEVDSLRAYAFFTYDDTGWSGTTQSDGVTGTALSEINYVLTKHGSTDDARAAVAVQFAIWLLRGSPGEAAWLAHHMTWVEAHGGASEMRRAEALADEARSAVASAMQRPAQESLMLSTGASFNTGSVSFPAGTARLRIEGGVFEDGSTVISTPAEAGVIGWAATPHEAQWNPEHEVRITGDWATGYESWPARLLVYPSIDPEQQTLAWAVGPVAAEESGVFETVTGRSSQVFEPEFSTRVVEARLSADGVFADAITITLPERSAPWPSRVNARGITEWFPVSLEGTLYGPFETPQQVSESAPSDAPIVSRVTVEADSGPGEYLAEAPEAPMRSGYYYWVWSLSADAQERSGHAAMLPLGYSFSDAFGLPEESHLVTMPEPPAEAPAPPQHARLETTGGAPAGMPGIALGALSFAAGSLLVVHAARRRARHPQQGSSVI